MTALAAAGSARHGRYAPQQTLSSTSGLCPEAWSQRDAMQRKGAFRPYLLHR